jgi:hypothetical protein
MGFVVEWYWDRIFTEHFGFSVSYSTNAPFSCHPGGGGTVGPLEAEIPQRCSPIPPKETDTNTWGVGNFMQNSVALRYAWFFPPCGSTAPSGPGPPHFRSFTITFRHTIIGRTTLDEWSVGRRDLYLTTQHSQETDIHAPGGIRTHNPSKRATVDRRLIPRRHWCRRYGWVAERNQDVAI